MSDVGGDASAGRAAQGGRWPGRLRAGPLAVARRYFSFAVAVLAVVLALLYVPSVSTSSGGGGSGSASSTNAIGSGRSQAALAPAPGTPGRTVGGYSCGPGVRQVPWSKYAPECLPAFRSSNGGATSHGVTGTTITITYRIASTTAEQALYSQVAPSVVGTNQSVIDTMNAYVKEFNKTYELYGRHVVLKSFTGKGDFLREDEGLDQQPAQADAFTARGLGSFADVSIIDSTQAYDQALAEQHVMAIGAIAMPQSWFEQYQPYAFSPWANCDKSAVTSGIVIGKAMAGMNAIYAGDASMQSKQRVFGVVYPQIPAYSACAQEAVQTAQSGYGVHINSNDVDPVELNMASLSAQASAIVARWKQDGVTSVLCACDPLSPLYLTQAADAQDYHPEWFSFSFGDAFGRLPAQDQWSHAISGGFASQPKIQQEAYRVYKLADPSGNPDPSFYYIYAPLLLLFDGLQAAGPDLTPQTFQAGLATLPTSLPGGMYGQWKFGPHVFDPPNSFGMTWWDPPAKSVADGLPGAWMPCNGGAVYTVSDRAATLPDHQQMACFGRSTGP